MADVTFDEFKKLDLVVGTVKSVQPHPNADKLYVLEVDLGEEQPRTLVAGPKAMRGIESRGMLLAAQEGDRVVIIAPEAPLAPGSKVL